MKRKNKSTQRIQTNRINTKAPEAIRDLSIGFIQIRKRSFPGELKGVETPSCQPGRRASSLQSAFAFGGVRSFREMHLKNFPKRLDSKTTCLRITVPENLDLALEGLIRKVLREQPKTDSIHAFAAEYFETLLKIRDKAGAKYTSEQLCPFHNDEDAHEMIKLANTFRKPSKKTRKESPEAKGKMAESGATGRRTDRPKGKRGKQTTPDLIKKLPGNRPEEQHEKKEADEKENHEEEMLTGDPIKELVEKELEMEALAKRTKAEGGARGAENMEGGIKGDNGRSEAIEETKRKDGDEEPTEETVKIPAAEETVVKDEHPDGEAETKKREETPVEEKVTNGQMVEDKPSTAGKDSEMTDRISAAEEEAAVRKDGGDKLPPDEVEAKTPSPTVEDKPPTAKEDRNREMTPDVNTEMINGDGGTETALKEPKDEEKEPENSPRQLMTGNDGTERRPEENLLHSTKEDEAAEVQEKTETETNIETKTASAPTEDTDEQEVSAENSDQHTQQESGAEQKQLEVAMEQEEQEKQTTEEEKQQEATEEQQQATVEEKQAEGTVEEKQQQATEEEKQATVEEKQAEGTVEEKQQEATEEEKQATMEEKQATVEEKQAEGTVEEKQQEATEEEKQATMEEKQAEGTKEEKQATVEEKQQGATEEEEQPEGTMEQEEQETEVEQKRATVKEKQAEGTKEEKQATVKEKQAEGKKEEKQATEEEKQQEATEEQQQATVEEKQQEATEEQQQATVEEKQQEATEEQQQATVEEKQPEAIVEKEEQEPGMEQKQQELGGEQKQAEATMEEKQKVATVDQKQQEGRMEQKQPEAGLEHKHQELKVEQKEQPEQGREEKQLKTERNSESEQTKSESEERPPIEEVSSEKTETVQPDKKEKLETEVERIASKQNVLAAEAEEVKPTAEEKPSKEGEPGLLKTKEGDKVNGLDRTGQQEKDDGSKADVAATEKLLKEPQDETTATKEADNDEGDKSGGDDLNRGEVEEASPSTSGTAAVEKAEEPHPQQDTKPDIKDIQQGAQVDDTKQEEEELCTVVDSHHIIRVEEPEAAPADPGVAPPPEEVQIKTIQTHYYDALRVPEIVTKEFRVHNVGAPLSEGSATVEDNSAPPQRAQVDGERTEIPQRTADGAEKRPDDVPLLVTPPGRQESGSDTLRSDDLLDLMTPTSGYSLNLSELSWQTVSGLFLDSERLHSSHLSDELRYNTGGQDKPEERDEIEEVFHRTVVPTLVGAVPMPPRDAEEIGKEETDSSLGEKKNKKLQDAGNSRSFDSDTPFISVEVKTVIETQVLDDEDDEDEEEGRPRVELAVQATVDVEDVGETTKRQENLPEGEEREMSEGEKGGSGESDSTMSSAATEIKRGDSGRRGVRAPGSLMQSQSLDLGGRNPLLRTRSLSAFRHGVTDFEVWSAIEKELEEAATKIQTRFRSYKARKKLQREDAVQITTEESSPSTTPAEADQRQQSTGEFHDSIVLSDHPR